MPAIDFRRLRETISMAQVLDLLRFEPVSRSGDQLRGACPIHESESPRSRSFSVHLGHQAYQCFKCGSAGNQLDLWSAATRAANIHAAALDLCHKVGIQVPWLPARNAARRKWTAMNPERRP